MIEHSKTHEYGGQIVRWQGLPLFFDPKSPDIVISVIFFYYLTKI